MSGTAQAVSQERISGREVAAILGISYIRLLTLIKDGHIPVIRLTPRGRMQFERSAIEAFLKASRTGYGKLQPE